jgi:hypothetical protein
MKKTTMVFMVIITTLLISCGDDHAFVVKKIIDVESSVDSTGNIITSATIQYEGREIIVGVASDHAAIVLLVAKEHNLLDKINAGGFYYNENDIKIESAGIKMK